MFGLPPRPERFVRFAINSLSRLPAYPRLYADWWQSRKVAEWHSEWATAPLARGWLCQGKDAGARPLVHAAAAADVRGGEYWGPGGWQEVTGRPALSTARPHTRDAVAAKALWDESERLTGLPLAI